MKKITIERSEGVAEVVDRMLEVEDVHIVFIIPKGSALSSSASNFRLLKREAKAADKTISIDSVDESIIALAEAQEIAIEPRGIKPEVVSDIVSEKSPREHHHKLAPLPEEQPLEKDGDSEDFFGSKRFFKQATVGMHTDENEKKPKQSHHLVLWTLGGFALVVGVLYLLTSIFGRATVKIDFRQTAWNYQGHVTADKQVTAPSGDVSLIPAQIFTNPKNMTQLFPATGASASISMKAKGVITIYNNYSAAPQDLVATTRFQTPDGKLFRLVNNVTVPGASVSGGSITPSSIDAQIVADQAGPDYNVGPLAKLSIPGFANTPAKYAGFYGSITDKTTGGFIGKRSVPTTADITAAKAKVTQNLQSTLDNSITGNYPAGFKILDGASNIQIGKLIISTTTDSEGNFSVFGNATLTVIGFDENALKQDLLTLERGSDTQEEIFKTISLVYSDVQPNFSAGKLSFMLTAQTSLEPAFSPDDLKNAIAGKSIGDARSAVAALPQLADGTISVWPIWLWNMPSNPSKISIEAN